MEKQRGEVIQRLDVATLESIEFQSVLLGVN